MRFFADLFSRFYANKYLKKRVDRSVDLLCRAEFLAGEGKDFKRAFYAFDKYLKRRDALGDDITMKFLEEGPTSFNAFREVFYSTHATSETMFRWEDEGDRIQCHLFDIKKITAKNPALRTSSGRIELSKYHFSGVDFMMAKFEDCSVRNLDMWRRTNFSCATFENCVFENVWFKYCNFMGATFKGCTFKDVHTKGIRLAGTKFIDCQMDFLNLWNCDDRGMVVENCKWDGEELSYCTLRDTGYNEDDHDIFFPDFNLYGKPN